MLYNIKNEQIKRDSTYIDYFCFGRGERPLLLIQGLNTRGIKGMAMPTAYMYRLFADKFKVYVFDRRNTVPENFSVWDMADDILFCMNVLGIDKADIFGVSQGGMIAQTLALKDPSRVNKLVLAVTASKPNETLKSVIGKWISCAQNGDYESINRDTFFLMYSEEYLKKYKLFLPVAVKLLKPDDLKKFAIFAKACITFDAHERLGEIKCPVLVIGGKQDKVTTAAASEELAGKLNCPIYMYEQYGHAAYDEAPDFNKRVFDFLVAGNF